MCLLLGMYPASRLLCFRSLKRNSNEPWEVFWCFVRPCELLTNMKIIGQGVDSTAYSALS